jgi:hypothetical protein
MELLFFRDPKTKGCGKKTGRGVIWVEKRWIKVIILGHGIFDQLTK